MKNIKDIAGGTLAIAALLGSAIWGHDAASAEKGNGDLPFWVQKECKFEDSVNCHFTDQVSLDGTDRSFIVRQVPGSKKMICVFFTNRAYARTHDYCA